jgi:protease IV
MPKLLAALLAALLLAPVGFAQVKPPAPPEDPQKKVVDKDEKKPDDKKPDDKKKKEEDSPLPRVAHIKLNGDLEEGATDDEPLGGTGLRAMLDRIQKATKDDKVKALYVELGALEIGFGKVNELRAAIATFRAAGKKAYAWAEGLDTKSYLVALACDSITLPESGGLEVVGLRAEVMFYKEGFKLLNLEADVLKMGKYKSAVEPYIADKMSDESREQIKSMMDDNFEKEIVAGMVAGRPNLNLTAKQAEELIDNGPYTAKKAAKLGLVDALKYQDEFEGGFAKAVGVDEVKVERNYGKPKAATKSILDMLAPKTRTETKALKIAVIHVVGGIDSGKGGFSPLTGSTVGSDTIVEAIREAEKNDKVKAIVLRVDSPGGSALASDIIWRELKVCKKPVVASMGDVAASGGYYVTMTAKKVFAEPGTVTGSIGVFGMKLVTGGAFEKFGLKTEVVSRGKNSGAGSSLSKWTESERKALTETVEDVYDQFLSKALAGRQANGQTMTREQLEGLAGGRVWTGRQAKANGLVDELGTLDDAVAFAKKEAGIDPKQEMELLMLPKATNFLDQLMEGGLPFGLSLSAELKVVPGADKALKGLAPLLVAPKDRVRMAMPYVLEWK